MNNKIYNIVNNKINYFKIIEIKGDLTFENNAEFSSSILELESKELKIAINMENVQFIDSSTIGIFIKLYRLITEKNGELVFFNINDSIQKIFVGNNLCEIFKLFDTIEEFEIETMNIDEI